MGNGQGKQSFSSGQGNAYRFIESQHAHALRRPISVLGLTDPNININRDYTHANQERRQPQKSQQLLAAEYSQLIATRRSFCADSDCSSDHAHQKNQHYNHRNQEHSQRAEKFVAHHNQRNQQINQHAHNLQKNKLLYASHETILNPQYSHRSQLFHSPSPNHHHARQTPQQQQQHYQRQESFVSDKMRASPSYHHHQQRQHHHSNAQNMVSVTPNRGKYDQQQNRIPNCVGSHNNQLRNAPLRHHQSSASANSYSHEKYHQKYISEKRRDANLKDRQPNADFRGGVKRNNNHYVQKKVLNKVGVGSKILPPLPRSHSFHQILKPTENGQILAKKGTIRGFNTEISTISVSTSDLRIENQETEESFSSGNQRPAEMNGRVKDTQEKEDAYDEVFPENPELTAILKYRRCKSETDLLCDDVQVEDVRQDHVHAQQTPHNKSQANDKFSVQALSNNHVIKPSNDHYYVGVQKRSDANLAAGHRSSPKPGVPNNGVAGKILKSKYRAPPPPSSSTLASSNLASPNSASVSKVSSSSSGTTLPEPSVPKPESAVNGSHNLRKETNVALSGQRPNDIKRLPDANHPGYEKKKTNIALQKTPNQKSVIHHASSSRLEITSGNLGVSRIPIKKGSSSNLNERNLVFDSNQIKTPNRDAKSGRQMIKVNSDASSRLNQDNKKRAMTRSSSNLLKPTPIGVFNNLSASLEINKEDIGRQDDDANYLLNQFEASIICQREDANIKDANIRRQKSLNNLDDADYRRHTDADPYGDQMMLTPSRDADYRKYHPAFDDNFILKRATPSAGLDMTLTPINSSSRLRPNHTPIGKSNLASDNQYYFAQLILPSPPASPPPSDAIIDADILSTNVANDQVTLSGGGTYSKRKKNILIPSDAQKLKTARAEGKDDKIKYSPAIIRWLSEREASVSSSELNESDLTPNLKSVPKMVPNVIKRAASIEQLSSFEKSSKINQGSRLPAQNVIRNINSRVPSFVSPTRTSNDVSIKAESSKNDLNHGQRFKVSSGKLAPITVENKIKRTNQIEVSSGPWAQAKVSPDGFILKRVTPNAGLLARATDNPLVRNGDIRDKRSLEAMNGRQVIENQREMKGRSHTQQVSYIDTP